MNRLDKRSADALVWLLLLTAPFWLPMVGGYIQLGSRIVVIALAVMALNFLLGFTGVLSFGHAAYFGLGAYGTAMTIKYLYPSTPVGMLVGIVVGTVAAAVIGPMITRLRGVYFAMCTIAFGQVFYFIAFQWSSVTGGDDGLSAWNRVPLDFGFATLDILHSADAFYYLSLAVFAVSVGVMAFLLRSPFGRTLLAIRENERRARFLGIPVDQHIWMSWVISCFFASTAGALYALMNNFVDPRALRWDSRALSSSWPCWAACALLGAADRRHDFRRAPGLHLEPHRELDVVHRPVLRAGRAVLPARRARHDPAEERAMSLLRGRERVAAVRQPRRRRQCFDDGRAGRAARRDRPQRRRQDHLLQPDQRLSLADLGPHRVRRRRTSRGSCRRGACGAASPAPFRSPRSFPSSRCARICASRSRSLRATACKAVAVARRRRRGRARASPSCWRWAVSPSRPTGWSAS